MWRLFRGGSGGPLPHPIHPWGKPGGATTITACKSQPICIPL